MIIYKVSKDWPIFISTVDLVPEDMNRAKELLEKAIELGSGSAAYRLGWMYERGFLSEEPDYVKALEFYEKRLH